MYSNAVAATFITLLSTSSALYFPRQIAARNGTHGAGGRHGHRLSGPTGTGTGSGAAGPTGGASPSGSTGGGNTYHASFTQYGAGDSFGSPNCNTASASCGFYSNPGFNAAASQNLFGAASGKGPACGTCWQLTPQTDSSGKPLPGTKEIVVKVNNLCPAQGNPLCSQKTLDDKNQYGANVNFDICKDDGAAAALFGTSGQQLAIGSATEVDCAKWKGSADLRQI